MELERYFPDGLANVEVFDQGRVGRESLTSEWPCCLVTKRLQLVGFGTGLRLATKIPIF